MREALLVAWVATIGADRIDLLAGSGPFLLTPFLVLTTLILGAEGTHLFFRGGRLRVPGRAAAYFLVATAFLVAVVLSTLFSFDVRVSASRSALLVFQLYATLAVALVLGSRPDPLRLLLRGAVWGVWIGVVFSVVQGALWLADVMEADLLGVITLSPGTFGPFAPRPTGASLDPNRGAFLFLVYAYLLREYGDGSRKQRLAGVMGVVFMLVTLSRSMLGSALVVWAAGRLRRLRVRLSPRRVLWASLGTAMVAALFVAVPPLLEGLLRFSEPFVDRMKFGDDSSSLHFDLIDRGVEVATQDLKNVLLGIGFGNALFVLEDFFPGNKYANFHSLYVTLLAEAGVFAFLFGMSLIGMALRGSRRMLPLMAGVLVFNVFYQTILEPMFWFLLVAAWLELDRAAESPPEAGAEWAGAGAERAPVLAAAGAP